MNVGDSSPYATDSARPAPGILLRRPPNSDNKTSAEPSDGTYNRLNKSSFQSSVPAQQLQEATDAQRSGRIAQRKDAIERRRLFLERGVNSLSSASLPVEDVSCEPSDVKVGIEEATSPTVAVAADASPGASSTETITKPTQRTPVHSLNNGRKLSAADTFRLQRHDRREEHRTQYQSSNASSTQGIQRIKRSKSASEMMGGSVVAAQSATARYRQSRRQQHQQQQQFDEANLDEEKGYHGDKQMQTGEGNLKTNPSVISIPLSESEVNSGGINASYSDSSLEANNFDERYQRLRRHKHEGNSEDGESKRWSLFGWFGNWGEKRS